MLALTLLLACGPDRSAQLAALQDETVPTDERDPVEDSTETTTPSTDAETTSPSTSSSTTSTSTTDPEEPWCWSEAIDPTAPIDDLQPVSHANERDVAFEVLRRRWPAGHDLLRDMEHDPYIDEFLDGSGWGVFLDSLLTTVHEETHGWDYEHAIYPSQFGYFMTADTQPFTPWDDSLPRSVIRPLIDDDATWLYADLYLTGTQGTYGFTELLDEANCYVNTLGAAVAVADGLPWGTSARDGAMTFVYYVGVYLDHAAENRPSTYAAWQADPEVGEVVRTLWIRTHFFLDMADQDPGLGVDDARIRPLMAAQQPVYEAFLGHSLEDGPCLPDGAP